MIIEVAQTPDPQVINLFPPIEKLNGFKAEFVDSKALRKSPLAAKIFDIGQIKSIFLSADMITVTKENNALWDNLTPQIIQVITNFLATGENVFVEDFSDKDNTVEEKIKNLIEARIRPALQKDGGDIAFLRFENGVAFVALQGNCVGCPYALITLKEGVEKVLKAYIPEIVMVINESAE